MKRIRKQMTNIHISTGNLTKKTLQKLSVLIYLVRKKNI